MRRTIEKILQLLSAIVSLALSYVLWHLDKKCNDKDSCIGDICCKYGTDKVGLYVFILCIVLVILPVVMQQFGYNKRVLRDWLNSQLLMICNDRLMAVDNSRVSIYRSRRGLFLIFQYFFLIGPKVLYANIRKHCFMQFLLNAPWIPWTKYHYLWDRTTIVKERTSQTFFREIFKGDVNCGIVCECFRSPSKVHNYHTESISDIVEWPKSCNNDKVFKYMKDMKFDETHYGYLRTMNQHSCSMAAVPLRLPKGSLWGIIVIEADDAKINKTTWRKAFDLAESTSLSFTNLYKKLYNE